MGDVNPYFSQPLMEGALQVRRNHCFRTVLIRFCFWDKRFGNKEGDISGRGENPIHEFCRCNHLRLQSLCFREEIVSSNDWIPACALYGVLCVPILPYRGCPSRLMHKSQDDALGLRLVSVFLLGRDLRIDIQRSILDAI